MVTARDTYRIPGHSGKAAVAGGRRTCRGEFVEPTDQCTVTVTLHPCVIDPHIYTTHMHIQVYMPSHHAPINPRTQSYPNIGHRFVLGQRRPFCRGTSHYPAVGCSSHASGGARSVCTPGYVVVRVYPRVCSGVCVPQGM